MNQTKTNLTVAGEAKEWRTLVTASYMHSMYDITSKCHAILSDKDGVEDANVISYEKGDTIVVLMYCSTSDFNTVVDALMNFETEK